MKEEILKVVRERGLLLEKNVIELIDSFNDSNLAKDFLLNIERISGQKMITLNLLNRNVEFMNSAIMALPGEEKSLIEKTFVRMGLSLEVRKEKEIIENKEIKQAIDYKIFYADTKPEKKLEVKDFTSHFRARYQALQRLLMQRTELQQNLVSIGKISGDRQSISLIGIVTEKRVTKNGNLMIKFEDLTGQIGALVKADNQELFERANDLLLDDIVGVKGSGNKDMLFVHDVLFPDSFLFNKTRFDEEGYIAFVSDFHCGSDRHLRECVGSFLDWLNTEDEVAKKIKYLFFVGDNVDGVGIFPSQEDFLELKSMKEQYELLASYIKRIPERINVFMCPGQHDAVRVAEPQPVIGKRYAEALYGIKNLTLVTNPSLIKLIEGDKEFKVLMYHGASIHSFIDSIKELRDIKAHQCPARAVRQMLKRRHLAPMHGDVVYIPNADLDPMVIAEVPDILCTGEVHRLDVENYNGTLIITGSCWQARTPFEEKVGNMPDPAKVPIFNLKTGALKIYDFGVKEEIGKWM